MARKVYKPGDRANVYIKKDVSHEMLDFINKQSDLTMFFLYAAQQLHKEIGNTDVAEILPRKYNFSLDAETKPLTIKKDEEQKPVPSSDLNQIQVESNTEIAKLRETHEEQEEKSWGSLNDLDDDPYA
ncbi:hypothetical protein COL63_25725 [Bacillus pseudomycoides]|uniref:hypothetical protein n=1 Tax=Bacillus pseudomycoides TaxID=64104 RepID=UPI000BF48B4C|nr:hypothetical protein [Bacillus pseudomycoides]PFZ08111.1 hypothetical protein COL63_25725 [Bacillus pseudomycoides]